uniref:Ig-like domain-containing protein n=1 Tax=Cyprinus carpio TaxID=7962 RepID=A0A8C2IXD5_CYPCA
MCNSQLGMRNSSCCCLCFPAFGNAAVNHTTTLFVNHGESAKIRCNYSRTDDTEIMTVALKALNHTCMCSYIHLNSWKKQSCKDHIRFIWNPEAEEISFELLNLHIKDTGKYTCIVRRTAKPPERRQKYLDVYNRHRLPFTTVTIYKVGKCMISEGFYPSALEQLWMRNGEFQNASLTYSINKTNPDGSFTLHSYLNISDCVNYSCWVNHSSLSQPTILHMSPDCYGSRGITYFFYLKYIITLNTIVHYSHVHPGRAHHRSPVRVNVTPEPDLQSHLQYDIYSLLGDHHPVHCIPVGVHSSPQRTPNVLH